jgi:YkoY family integral membrane protein
LLQTFSTGDLGVVAFLVLLEGLLSADNAVVLSIMVRGLAPAQQKRALLYGLGGAFAFRLTAILLATFLIRLWWLQALGAAYLLYLPIAHFLAPSSKQKIHSDSYSFWRIVLLVELTDITFAMDSVLAGVAVVKGDSSKIWVVYSGAVIGIVLLRFAAGAFTKLMERYPALDNVAYVLVCWVGVKLAMVAGNKYSVVHPEQNVFIPEMHGGIFWSVMAAICLIGILVAVRARRQGWPDMEVNSGEEQA